MAEWIERNLVVVAHQDDDLIFINPTVQRGIRRGSPTRVVYVTAGEHNGNGTTREAYAGRRRDGECAAYSAMSRVANRWTRRIAVVGDRSVDLNTLTAAPHVELVFVGLPDGGDALHLDALTRLWAEPGATATTIVYPGSPVGQSQTYDRTHLLAVLEDLIAGFRPTVVLVQDAEPDPLLAVDHPDHIACARFARAATRGYATASRARPIVIEHRDYAVGDFAQNLTDNEVDEKKDAFVRYAAHDSAAGDLPHLWLRRQFPRWSPGTAWVGSDGAGRLHALSGQGDGVWHWRQAVAGGPFDEPVDIGGGRLAPGLAVGRTADGRVAVFAVDLDSHDIVTTRQTTAGGVFPGWTTLGNPSGPNGRHTGAPATGVNADGRLQVFVRNSGGGVSTTFQTAVDGLFSAWLDLGGGSDVQGIPVCLTRLDGRMVLFASRRASIRMWSQTTPNGPWSGPVDLTVDTITSAPTAALNADGRLQVFWRGTAGDVRTTWELAIDGLWSGAPSSLGGPGGVGEVAALTAAGAGRRIFLVARGPEGDLHTTSQAAPDAPFGAWHRLGGLSPGTPALVSSGAGHPLAFHVATDGRLFTTAELDGPRAFDPVRAVADRAATGVRALRAGVERAGAAIRRRRA